MDQPNINRRRLLIGLAAASSAAAVPVAALATTGTPENPELLRLGDALPQTEAAMTEAEAAYWRTVDQWSPSWPIAPEAISEAGHWPWNGSRCERSLHDFAMLPDGRLAAHGGADEKPRSVNTAADYQQQLKRLQGDLRRKRPRHPLSALDVAELELAIGLAQDRLALANAYEAEKARVKAASGIEAATARRNTTREALAALVASIMAEPEHSMAGVIIKAQALAAWGKNPMHALHVPGLKWPQELAASILRFAGENASQSA